MTIEEAEIRFNSYKSLEILRLMLILRKVQIGSKYSMRRSGPVSSSVYRACYTTVTPMEISRTTQVASLKYSYSITARLRLKFIWQSGQDRMTISIVEPVGKEEVGSSTSATVSFEVPRKVRHCGAVSLFMLVFWFCILHFARSNVPGMISKDLSRIVYTRWQ